ncbi:MAG: hypothetical protein JOZ41_22955 [Chloroflexi bacterium]|nr:hypothetical protein [Chloroflexota bacterium]
MTRRFGPLTRRRAVVLVCVTVVALGGAVAQARAWVQIGGTHSGPGPMKTAIAEKEAIANRWMTPIPGEPTPPASHPGQYPPCPTMTARDVPHAGEVRSRAQDGFPVPFSPMVYDINTLWQDVRDDMELQIWAGALGDDRTQGVIAVAEGNGCTGRQGPHGEFRTPSKVGPLTLTGVVGNAVSFSYPGGAGSLDLSTRQFALPSHQKRR